MAIGQTMPTIEEFCARFLPPTGYEDHCVVESRGLLVWMKREDMGPHDVLCFYDGDCRDVLKPDDPRLRES
jgi:hypothetical protein